MTSRSPRLVHLRTLLLLLLLALLAGCADPAGAPPTPPPTTQARAAQAQPQPVTIQWWHINPRESDRANWQRLADAFTAANPHVTFEISPLASEAFKDKLAIAMQSGDPPDLFHSWGGGVLAAYAEAGLVQDLSAALQQDGWGDSFHPAPLSLYAVNGRSYGVPWQFGAVGFWYNKALFREAGIAAPPATWDELLEAVRRLKAAGITPIALGEQEKWPGHFYWVYLAMREGGQEAFQRAYSRQGSFADPAFVRAGEHLQELIALEPFQPGFLGASSGDQASLMANGEVAMELMGQWAPDYARSLATDPAAYDENIGFFPFPLVEGGAGDPRDVLGGADGFAVGRNAPPETVEFLRFLTSVEQQRQMAGLGLAIFPAVRGAEDAVTDPALAGVQQTAANATYFQLYYDQALPPAVGQTVNDATQMLFAGAATPEQVARSIEEAAARALGP